MKRVTVDAKTLGRIQVEAILVKGPLAVTRALAPIGAGDVFRRGRRCWTITHLRTGFSLTQGRALPRGEAIAWLERALKANNWARETAKTWARRSIASKQRIWFAMLPGGSR